MGWDVQEMLDAFLDEVIVGIGELSNTGQCMNTVDIRDDLPRSLAKSTEQSHSGETSLLHRDVPVDVHDRLQPDRRQRNMPGLDWRWGRVQREQLDVDCITLVWPIVSQADLSKYFMDESEHTDRDHALAVVVQVFHDHLTNVTYIHLSFSPLLSRPRQPPTLLLASSEQPRDLPHHAQVTAKLHVLIQHDGKIEDELVSRIARRRADAHRMPEDAMVREGNGDQTGREGLSRDEEGEQGVKVEQRLRGRCLRGS